MILPELITSCAYRASNGELAWRRQDVPAALSAIAACGQAVLSGEVWIALGDGRWYGLIPDRCGGPDGVWHWSTAPRSTDELWQAYCDRAAEESAHIVAQMRVEEESASSVEGKLWFNLTYVPEAEASIATPARQD